MYILPYCIPSQFGVGLFRRVLTPPQGRQRRTHADVFLRARLRRTDGADIIEVLPAKVTRSCASFGIEGEWEEEPYEASRQVVRAARVDYNFDSFDQIPVTNGGGDVSVQSSGLSINLVTKITATKRYSDRWQMQVALTLQRMPDFFPEGSPSFNNPTNREFSHGFTSNALGDREWLFKASGSYTFPLEITASANFNVNQGLVRIVSINGPGSVPAGRNAAGSPLTLSYGQGSLRFQPNGDTRLEPQRLLDLGLQKTFMFRGGRNRVKLMVEAFNVFNINTVTGWVSNNMSAAGFTQPSGIVPPRVFRVGTQIGF